MKFSAAITTTVVALAMARAQAWIPTTTPPSPTRNVSLEASRSKQKTASRSAWAESRGYMSSADADVVSAAAAGSASSSSGRCTVLGGGRIGSLLASGGGGEVASLKGRGDMIEADGSGPIFIATRNDALDQIVEDCPENRRGDLVFLQNGYLDGFLESKGLLENTQALLFLSVTAKGVAPVDGITAVNPEGLTAATGPHARALADRLAGLGLKCNVLSGEDYRPAMFEKLIWISTYMLVGTAKECKSVGQAGSDHAELVKSIVDELISAVSAKEGITFSPGAMERLSAYTDVVTDFPCVVKEFEWRNRYFYDLGDDACSVHNGLLRECAEKGLLGFELL